MNAWSVLSLLLFPAACHGCESSGGQPTPASGVTVASLTVTSRSFSSNGPIPVDRTCDGADTSPELTFSAPPPGTKTFAVVADDPDALSGTFTHWVAYNIPGDLLSLPEGADLPAMGAATGTNDFSRQGYAGPCPPRGEVHRYVFRVFALNAKLDVAAGASRSTVLSAMGGRLLAQGALVGTFSH